MKPIQRLTGERSEAGETLVEVILAAAIMAIVVVGILGGLGTVLIGSMVHRDQATGNSVLLSAMENLKSADVSRFPCAPKDHPAYVNAVSAAQPASWDDDPDPLKRGTVKIDTITYQKFDLATGMFSLDGLCTETAANGLTLQLITVSATPPGSRDTRTLSFVKGDN